MGINMKKIIRIGTRRSALAMIQTELVVNKIKKIAPELELQIVQIVTTGDKILNRPLDSFGGKGIFVSEMEEAILQGDLDLAVHSAKDMPTELPKGLEIVATLEREDERDVLVTAGKRLEELKIVGTSSVRREIQLKRKYPYVQCRSIRGNVETRLKKLKNKEYDGIVLAAAGLKRLGLWGTKEYEFNAFSVEEFVPAGGQGIIAIEGRKESEIIDLMKKVNHIETYHCLEVEREGLKLLNAGCHEPVAIHSTISGEQIMVRVLQQTGERLLQVEGKDKLKERVQLVKRLIEQIKEQ